MKIKYQLLANDAKCPFRASEMAAGYDLYAFSYSFHEHTVTYHTKVAMEIPKGYTGLLFPRSSVYKTGMHLANSVGVIDSDYRGEIMFKYYVNDWQTIYEKGERVGQIVIVPTPDIEFELTDMLSDTLRSGGGFGSTGK
jgi:dUTP pyrophosphatase